MSTEPLQLLTVIDAAEQLQISRSKIYELIADGELPSIRIGQSRRITTSDLADFVARHAEGATTRGSR